MFRHLIIVSTTTASLAQWSWGDNDGSSVGGSLLDMINGNLNKTAKNLGQNTTITDVYETIYGAASIFEAVPVGKLVTSVDALRQAGLLKTANIVTTQEAKKLSYPPDGTEPAQGSCSKPTKGVNGKIAGGFTVCIPATAVPKIDSRDESSLPRLGNYDNAPIACRSILMTKGSPFDGSYCVSALYEDDTCDVGKIQGSESTVMYEAVLHHDQAMNDVVIRCSVTKQANETYSVTTDVGYEVDQETAALSSSSIGTQTGTILSILPTIISTSMVTSLTGYSPSLSTESASTQNKVTNVASILSGIANLFINTGAAPVVEAQSAKAALSTTDTTDKTSTVADKTTGIISGISALASTVSGVGSTASYADILNSFRSKRRLRGIQIN